MDIVLDTAPVEADRTVIVDGLLEFNAELRGQNLGSRLMAQAEAHARAQNLAGIWLDTYSFQARPFYEKLGFTVVGEIPDMPPGGARYFLSKPLRSAL